MSSLTTRFHPSHVSSLRTRFDGVIKLCALTFALITALTSLAVGQQPGNCAPCAAPSAPCTGPCPKTRWWLAWPRGLHGRNVRHRCRLRHRAIMRSAAAVLRILSDLLETVFERLGLPAVRTVIRRAAHQSASRAGDCGRSIATSANIRGCGTGQLPSGEPGRSTGIWQ